MDVGAGAPAALLEDPERSLFADAAELGQRWHGAAEWTTAVTRSPPRFALSCSPGLLRGCAELARAHGWLLQTHAAENQ